MYINGEKLNVRRYSSGELKFIKSKLDSYIVDGKVNILYTGSFSVFELLLILRYYKKNNILINLVLNYLPYQRMDHEGRDELDTVNFVADVFNELELNSITICEPHCNVDMFKNVKIFSYVNYIKGKVYDEINFNEKKDRVIFTDEGGLKRYGKIFNTSIYFKKVRDKETGLIVEHKIIGDISCGNRAIIVDDIISTGDTIVNIIDTLVKKGVKEIYVLVGHFENNKYNKRIIDNSNVIKVYSSNSLKKRGNKKLKLYNVEDMF